MPGRNLGPEIIDIIPVTGALALNSHTLKAATAVVDNGDGTVKLTTTAAHGLLTGSVVYIEGSVNYNGLQKLVAIPAATTFSIKAKYVAETTAGTETVKIAAVPKRDFNFLGFRLHLSAAPGEADVFSITVDSVRGAAYDHLIYSVDITAAVNVDYIYPSREIPFRKGDKLRVAWPNAAGRTFGLELYVQPLN